MPTLSLFSCPWSHHYIPRSSSGLGMQPLRWWQETHLSAHFEPVFLPLVSLLYPQVFFWAWDAATEVVACLRPVVALAWVCIMWVGGGDVARKL